MRLLVLLDWVLLPINVGGAVFCLCLLLSGCAARSYTPTQTRVTLTSALQAVSLERIDGRCVIRFAIKGDPGIYTKDADDACDKGALVDAATRAAAPKPAAEGAK